MLENISKFVQWLLQIISKPLKLDGWCQLMPWNSSKFVTLDGWCQFLLQKISKFLRLDGWYQWCQLKIPQKNWWLIPVNASKSVKSPVSIRLLRSNVNSKQLKIPWFRKNRWWIPFFSGWKSIKITQIHGWYELIPQNTQNVSEKLMQQYILTPLKLDG